jgi:hypothetical protein
VMGQLERNSKGTRNGYPPSKRQVPQIRSFLFC